MRTPRHKLWASWSLVNKSRASIVMRALHCCLCVHVVKRRRRVPGRRKEDWRNTHWLTAHIPHSLSFCKALKREGDLFEVIERQLNQLLNALKTTRRWSLHDVHLRTSLVFCFYLLVFFGFPSAQAVVGVHTATLNLPAGWWFTKFDLYWTFGVCLSLNIRLFKQEGFILCHVWTVTAMFCRDRIPTDGLGNGSKQPFKLQVLSRLHMTCMTSYPLEKGSGICLPESTTILKL